MSFRNEGLAGAEDPSMLEPPRLALSVRQPWAELILTGRKTIELRTWTTSYRGPLWLHTGTKRDPQLEAGFGFDGLYHGGFVGVFTYRALCGWTEAAGALARSPSGDGTDAAGDLWLGGAEPITSCPPYTGSR